MPSLLPHQRQALVENNKTTSPFYSWFSEIERKLRTGALSSDQATEAIAAIATALGSPDGTVAHIPDQTEPVLPLLFGINGVKVFGQLKDGDVRIGLDQALHHSRRIIDFTFGDASPSPIYTILESSANVLLRIVIRTPFNGVGAALSLNAVSGPTLLASSAVAPGIAGGYEAAPDAVLTAGDVIRLVITPGTGATAGSGSIIVDTIPLLEN